MSNAVQLYSKKPSTLVANEEHKKAPRADRGLLTYVLFGMFAVFILIGGMGYWSLTAKLNGAVIAPASFVVESNRKTVQHLEGGIVRDLLVKEGDYVSANQVLLRMDSTDSTINIDVLGAQLAELSIRRARLVAEINSAEVFDIGSTQLRVLAELDPDNRRSLITVQQNLFNAQVRARKSEKEILEQRIIRFEQEIDGLELQRQAGARQLTLLEKDIVGFKTLLKRKLVAASRVNGLQRNKEQLHGADANLVTSQARAANQIEELKLNMISQQRLRHETISTELAEIETRISSIQPQYLGAKERFKRVAITAPVSGRVVGMKVYTKGGVIRSGEPILDIVPETDELVVEARVATKDIDKLYIGQDTRVRLAAFDQADIPEALGKIIGLSADALTDDNDGSQYYAARVRLNDDQQNSINELDFIPGMPADVFVNTGERTAINYFLKPLRDRLARTFVE